MGSRNEATTDGTDHSPAAQLPEVRIQIWHGYWVKFEGTRARLEYEGLIPAEIEWPQPADKGVRWTANGVNYWLRHARPEDFKGPRRAALELDNWAVSFEPDGWNITWSQRFEIERAKEELKAAIYRQSDAGRRDWEARFAAYWRTREDKRFQAFKAKVIPERKRPGRQPSAQG